MAFWFDVRWVACAALLAAGCAVGRGDGDLEGTLDVVDCARGSGAYRMRPTFFGAEPVDALLEIRVQRGSGMASVADGVQILVWDAADVQANHLGEELPVNNELGPVGITLFLNDTCPPASTRSPVTLPAVSGRVRFDSIYAPEGDSDEVEISGEILEARFADPRNAARNAELSGHFQFLFERGRPAQLFP